MVENMTRLDRVLRPKSVAVVGGSEAAKVIEQCQKMGFSGEIWPVNPNRRYIAQLPALPDIQSLPSAPDVAYIAVNRELTIAAVEALRDLGAGGAVCYASGFGELDDVGKGLQEALLVAAGDMPIIGPNCYGLINYVDGVLLWPDQQGGVRLDAEGKGAAIIAQSSNIAINFSMAQRGLPISYLATVGNQAKVGLSEMAMALLEDPRVSALGLHIEGFDDISTMEKLGIRARELRKPIVVLIAILDD